MSLKAWVDQGHALGASDLHLEAGVPPVARVRGELLTVGEALPQAELDEILKALGNGELTRLLEKRGSADLSTVVGSLRCRINIYRTVRGTALAVRLLAPALAGLRAANLHPGLSRFLAARTGLVLVSGPTGCGKSTTLAALVEEVNATEARHVITLESPLEYLFSQRRAFIRQREIPTHSPSFEQAITDALRENPDILVIGEMRTPEVMRLTLDAAQTGHLVFATLHSASCAEALARICMSFPAEAQPSIRAQLADCLVGVVCQRLDYLETLALRVPRCEILTASTAAKSTIRGGQLAQLTNVIQAGGGDGMWTFERYGNWMAQKQDWVHPPAGAEQGDADDTGVPAFGEPPTLEPLESIVERAPPLPSSGRSDTVAASPADGDEIEIAIDLEREQDLAELLRQLEEQHPG